MTTAGFAELRFAAETSEIALMTLMQSKCTKPGTLKQKKTAVFSLHMKFHFVPPTSHSFPAETSTVLWSS